MSIPLNYFVLISFTLNILFGFQVLAIPYDYSFTHECLSKPLSAQYNGGIVTNSELDQGLMGWTTFGDARVEHVKSTDGNRYMVASNRSLTFQSFSQTIHLEKDKLYTISAWLQVSDGNADIAAKFKTRSGYFTAGWVTAKKGCWSMLKGGLTVHHSGPSQLYFESNNSTVDIWADSISLQPFTQEEWKSHQDDSIQKARKRTVKIRAVDQQGQPIANATVSLKQRRLHFPLGCATNQNILRNPAYQNWFLPRFKHTTFENELKWYSTEATQGREDYSVADAMVHFARSHGIAVRGHNVFWDDPKFQQSWLKGLSSNDMRAAAGRRINSVMWRYRGQFFHWDVENENVHFDFFERRLGGGAAEEFYQTANRIDPRTTPFLNDYNTIEDSRDWEVAAVKYLHKIEELRRAGYNGPLGIGLESHFTSPNIPYIRSSIDALASARLPIWITELDVASGPNQAVYLEQLLRELHSHVAIEGIIIWSAWSPQGCYRMCLTDNNFRNLASGDVVDKFKHVLTSAADSHGTTDSNGYYHTSLFHGQYEATIIHPNPLEFNHFSTFYVLPNQEQNTTFHFQINL